MAEGTPLLSLNNCPVRQTPSCGNGTSDDEDVEGTRGHDHGSNGAIGGVGAGTGSSFGTFWLILKSYIGGWVKRQQTVVISGTHPWPFINDIDMYRFDAFARVGLSFGSGKGRGGGRGVGGTRDTSQPFLGFCFQIFFAMARHRRLSCRALRRFGPAGHALRLQAGRPHVRLSHHPGGCGAVRVRRPPAAAREAAHGVQRTGGALLHLWLHRAARAGSMGPASGQRILGEYNLCIVCSRRLQGVMHVQGRSGCRGAPHLDHDEHPKQLSSCAPHCPQILEGWHAYGATAHV
jgi:hypothetical protein